MMSPEGVECNFEAQRPRIGFQLKDILITADLAKRAYREPNWKAQSIGFFGGSLRIESNETGTSVRAVLPQQSSLSMVSGQTA
jgi:signal transduction histidine kinase